MFNFQSVKDELERYHVKIEAFNETYQNMAIESRQTGTNIPEHVQHKVDMLNADWRKIKQLAATLRVDFEPSVEEKVFAEGERLFSSNDFDEWWWPFFYIW